MAATAAAGKADAAAGKADVPSLQGKMPDASSPLLEEGTVAVHFTNYTFSPGRGVRCSGDEGSCHKALASHGITDTMMYRTKSLSTWEAFSFITSTVWLSTELWKMVAKLFCVALVFGVVAIFVVKDPARMKVSKFTDVSKFLNVVVGLLLGFFLSSSVVRWYNCVNGFLELLDAIRNLQMQFVALGVPDKEALLCLRWGFSSGWLLYGQLLIETEHLVAATGGTSVVKRDKEAMWDALINKTAMIDKSLQTKLLNKREADLLKMTRDPPGMMWMWVAAYIGRLANDGWIPPMQSPTYGRIMNLCQSAHGGIRQVRQSISIQAPLSYTHMLASLVHVNNLLNAITLGIVTGITIGITLDYHGLHPTYPGQDGSGREVAQDQQSLVITFMYCFFGPLIYQALLLIGMHLAQPFDSEYTAIPFDRLLHQLEVDMCNGRDLVENLPFEKPAFKQPPAPAPKA